MYQVILVGELLRFACSILGKSDPNIFSQRVVKKLLIYHGIESIKITRKKHIQYWHPGVFRVEPNVSLDGFPKKNTNFLATPRSLSKGDNRGSMFFFKVAVNFHQLYP